MDKLNNNETIKTATNQVKIDKTSPAGTIKINSDATYTNATLVSVSLSASDSGSGLSQMKFSNDNITWSTPEAYATPRNWTLPSGDGTKTVWAKFKDVAGSWSTTEIKDSITLDTTKPTTPTVTDDGATTNSTTQLHANWSSSDTISGIAEYQYKITQDSTGGTTIIDWTSTGTATSVTKTGLSLAAEKTYYFSVKAKNGAGLWSEIGYADGIKVTEADTTPPQITAITPQDGSTLYEGDIVVIRPTVSDTDPSPLEYQFSIDGIIQKAWSAQNSYTWQAPPGKHNIKIEVRDTGGADTRQIEVYVFKKAVQPPN